MIDQAEATSAERAREVRGTSGADIQLAIDALPAGGLVVLRAQRYLVSQTIILHDGITLTGAGTDRTSIELLPDSGCHVFTNANHDRGNRDIVIEGLSVEGNGEHQAKPVDQKALSFCNVVYFKRVQNVRISHLTARNIRQTAVHFSGSQEVRIDDLVAEHLGWSGVSTSGTDGLVISNTFVRDAGRDVLHSGIHLDGGHGVRMIDVQVSSCTGNAIMLDSTFGSFSSCDLVRVDCADSKRGISLSGSAKHDLRGVAVRNSSCRNNREVGILVSNASDVLLCDNIIEANLENGVLLQGRSGAHRCTIVGCTFIANKLAIGEIHASSDNTFLDNRFVANGADVVRRVDSRTAATPPTSLGAPQPPAYSSTVVPAATPITPQSVGSSATSPERAEGRCWVCGHRGWFLNTETSIRESFRCEACRASVRYQAKAAVLVQLFSREGATCVADLAEETAFQSLSVFEPGVLGPFRKIFGALPHYVVSDYWPDVPPGEQRDGVRCEDLMNLTHPAESFDLLITSDIFEHVRRPRQAFDEIRRVLRKGGTHLFSIPVQYPLPRQTVRRVDCDGPEDVLLMEARYHKGPGNSRHIVYNDFGADLVDELNAMGLASEVVRFEPMFPNSDRVVTFYSVRSA